MVKLFLTLAAAARTAVHAFNVAPAARPLSSLGAVGSRGAGRGGVYEDLTGMVGNTPVVKISDKLAPEGVEVYAKCEYFNPLSSVKDRLAVAIIEEAEASGALRPLVDHLASVLRGESPLGVQPWMQPVLLALEGSRKHLLSEHLRAHLALTLRADTESEEGHELTVHLAGPTSLFYEPGQPAACCFSFKHEINLLDFVEDLAELFSALTTKLAAQTPYVSIAP